MDAGESVCRSSFCLTLKPRQYPSGLRPEEVALLIGLDEEYPSSGHTVLRFDLPQINEIKNLIVNPGFPLEMFRFSKLLVVPRTFLADASVHISFWLLLLRLFTGGHTAFQHSGLTVNSFWEFNLCAAGIVDHFIQAQ